MCLMARESGWSENRARLNAIRRTSSSVPANASTPTSCRSPAVNVPVLSSATTSTFANASSAAPPRNNTPRRAPNAMADRIADGMLNTSAHGDATTSNVIAR